MNLTPGQKSLAQYWSIIQSGVEAGMTTAALWSAVRDAHVAEFGKPLSGASAADMNDLRALASVNRNAAQSFARAGDNIGITGDMIGETLHNPLDRFSTDPRELVVRYEHTVLRDGEEVSIWRTSVFAEHIMPATKADLLSELEGAAQDAADSYGETHIGLDNVHIMAA